MLGLCGKELSFEGIKIPTILPILQECLTLQICIRTGCKVKPVLETTCIKRPPALRDHCSDTTTILKST